MFIVRHKTLFITILSLLLVKVVWVVWSCWGNGTFEEERDDIIERKNYLVDKIVVDPLQLLNEMPHGIGLQFQGEWALYSCSMLTSALANIAELYPETREKAVSTIDSLVRIVKSPTLSLYDFLRWGEEPLESLDGADKSHVSYLSHLAWMIGNYRRLSGDDKYDNLHDSLCATMNRRILHSPILNLPTYPDEPIYVPDMMVAIVALSDYNRLNDGKYAMTVKRWLEKAKNEWCDVETGLLASFLDENGKPIGEMKGSYSALNCYYLTLLDDEYAGEQYDRLKKYFRQNFPVSGIKEYHDRSCLFGNDIDAGPIILNLSPSGTAFAIGSATYMGDDDFRRQLLKTAEIAGHTVKWNGRRHYLLANIVLVGEAITLAMRTNARVRGRNLQ